MAEMVRLNTRISADLNKWLDEESERTGVPKSTIIFLALEQYYTQKIALKGVADLNNILFNKLEQFEKKLESVK